MMNNLPPSLNEMPQGMSQGMNNHESQEPVNILAHVSPDEIPSLNEMQGKEIIDPETGLRDYTLLSSILQTPEGMNALGEAESMVEAKHMAEGGHVEQHGRPIAPEIEELRQAGRHGDTELIIITPELADIFSQMKGGKVTINPITGFPEFGFFKEILRAAGTVMGPVSGFIASKITGQSTGAALKNAGIGAALSLSAMGGFNPLSIVGIGPSGSGGGFGGFLGGSGSGGMGPFSFLGGGAQGNTAGANTAGRVLSGGAYGKSGASGPGGNVGGGQGGGILSQLGGLGTVLPLAASGFMAMKGARDEKKSLQQYDDKQKRDLEEIRQRYGFNDKWKDVKPLNRELDLEYTAEDKASGRSPKFYKPYELGKVEYMKDGGAIRGFGKGQQDNIPRKIPENSYIIDASSVSDIGDGSSDAGYKELESFFAKVPSHPMHKKRGGYIDALVSDGEYEVSPEKVSALGGGSNKKGAAMLENLVKELRKSKRTSGEKLPPKSKAIGGYLKTIRMA